MVDEEIMNLILMWITEHWSWR